MPQRVLGILDDPQRVLAIFLQKKAQNALWAILIRSMNATTRCGNLSEFAKCPQRIVGTPT